MCECDTDRGAGDAMPVQAGVCERLFLGVILFFQYMMPGSCHTFICKQQIICFVIN